MVERDGSHAVSKRKGLRLLREPTKFLMQKQSIVFPGGASHPVYPCYAARTAFRRRDDAGAKMARTRPSRRLIVRVQAALVAAAISLPGIPGAVAQDLSCGTRKTCKQMRSCTEAVFHLRQCGDRKRDGDGDGIPCENLCGDTLAQMNRRLDAGL